MNLIISIVIVTIMTLVIVLTIMLLKVSMTNEQSDKYVDCFINFMVFFVSLVNSVSLTTTTFVIIAPVLIESVFFNFNLFSSIPDY